MKRLRLYLLWFLWLWAGLVHGQPIAVRDLAVLVDEHGTETISSVSASAAATRFVPLVGALTAGYTRKVHWLRFNVQVPKAGRWWLEVQPPFLDDLRLFEPGTSGFIERRSGDRQTFEVREEDDRGFVFKLLLPDPAARTFYLRLATDSSAMVALQLWNPRQFRAATNSEYVALGFYYGITCLAMLTMLILSGWLRVPQYGWFGLVIFANILFDLGINGFVSQYFLRSFPQTAELWLSVGILLVVFATGLYLRSMWPAARTAPEQSKKISAPARSRVHLEIVLLAVLWLSVEHYPEAKIFALSYLLFCALLVIDGLRPLWLDKRTESRYLFLSAVFLLAGSAVTIVLSLGWVSSQDLSVLYLHQLTLVCAALVMIVSMAMSMRRTFISQWNTEKRAQDAEQDSILQQRALAEQGRFVAMLSHEIKTPLAVIDSATQALERINQSEDAAIVRRHERIRRSVNRIDRLIEQFLTADQIALQRMQISPGRVDVSKFLDRIFATYSTEDAQRLVALIPVQTAALVADAKLLQVALTNLIDNALKYSPVAGKVRVSANPANEQNVAGFEFIVADEGAGVPRELEVVLFSRYARGENATSIPGTGLGLYLVQRIAQLHGGQAELLPKRSGAVFRIWVPIESEGLP